MAELLTYLTRLHETPRYYGAGLYRQLNKKNIFLWSQAIAFKVLITVVPVVILATGILAEILEQGDHKPDGAWRDAVKAFRGRFTEMRYCL